MTVRQAEPRELEAGRELDILIAERVMGWTRWDIESGEDCPCEPGVTYFADWGDMGGVSVYTPPHLTGGVEFYFEPSSDIADAWRVVNKLCDRFWMTLLTPFEVGDGFHVSFTPHGQPEHSRRVGHALAHTTPHAICLAALRAIESA